MNANTEMTRLEELSRFANDRISLFALVHAGADKALWHEVETLGFQSYANLLPADKQDSLGKITPFLVRLDFDDSFTQWMLENEHLMQDAFFVGSALAIEDLSQRFKRLIFCRDGQGKTYYFGFYVAQTFVDYLMYLRAYEPTQCRGLFEGVEFFLFNKCLFTNERQSESDDNACYLALGQDEYLEGLPQESAFPSSYLPASFFDFFSRQRIHRYKQAAYENLCKQYPDSAYSQQEKKHSFNIMDDIIQSASGYGITDEDAVHHLFEASWLFGRNVFESPRIENFLLIPGGQVYRTAKLLNAAKEACHG